MVKIRETSKRVYLVGNVLKNMDSDKCPTKRTVLANFLYLRMEEKKSVRESLGEVIKNIEAIWQSLDKAVGVRRNSIKKLEKLASAWAAVNKNRSRKTTCQIARGIKFAAHLEEVFDISQITRNQQHGSTINNYMHNERDLSFALEKSASESDEAEYRCFLKKKPSEASHGNTCNCNGS